MGRHLCLCDAGERMASVIWHWTARRGYYRSTCDLNSGRLISILPRSEILFTARAKCRMNGGDVSPEQKCSELSFWMSARFTRFVGATRFVVSRSLVQYCAMIFGL